MGRSEFDKLLKDARQAHKAGKLNDALAATYSAVGVIYREKAALTGQKPRWHA